MSKEFLKINIKSLAAEAKIIRKDENKFKRLSKHDKNKNQDNDRQIWLEAHRTYTVRNESRSALLAYGYMKGIPYKKMEAKCYEKPDLTRIADNLIRFDSHTYWHLDNLPRKEWVPTIVNYCLHFSSKVVKL